MARGFAAPAAGRPMAAGQAWQHGIPAELVGFVKKTYGLLFFSLVLFAAGAWGINQIIPWQDHLLRDGTVVSLPNFPQWAMWLLWGGSFVFGMIGNAASSGARQGEASPLGLVGLFGMVLCTAGWLGPTLGMYVGAGAAQTVVAAALTTVVVFAGLTSYVLVTGKNFSFMGGVLGIAFLAFFAAWMVNAIFFRSAEFQWWMAAGGAFLFGAIILWHTSSIIRFYGPQNLVVPAVIALFTSIINLFIMLLILFSGRRN